MKWKKKIEWDSLGGYEDICENVGFLTELSQKGSVPVGAFAISVRTFADEADWHYILTQKEAEDLSCDGTYIKALSMKWRKIG